MIHRLHFALRARHTLSASFAAGLLALSCGGGGGTPGTEGTGAAAGSGAGATMGVGGASANGGSNQGGTGTAGAGAAGSAGTSAGAGQGGTAAGAGGTGGTGVTTGGAAGTGGSGGAPVAGEWWIAPDGDDLDDGSEGAPFKTLDRAQQYAQPGHTIWVKPGTYNFPFTIDLVKSGTAGNLIKLFAASGTRPVFDFTGQTAGQRGFELEADYWHIKGIEITKATDNGMLIRGSNNVVELVVLHHNGDTGLQITVDEELAAFPQFGANNLILNCDSYENLDQATGGENADGFAAKERIGAGNVFRGCRAWNNADDGWDMFAADDVVTIENCWAFLNGKATAGSNPSGDGNGFKLGGEPDGVGQGHAPHVVTGSAAFDNASCGFTRNNNDDTPVLSQCYVGSNETDYCDVSCSNDTDISTSGAEAKAIARNADGSLPPLD